MNRRGFMGSILALAAAPAIVRADSLMRIVPRETVVLWGRAALNEVWWRYSWTGPLGTESMHGLTSEWADIERAAATRERCGGSLWVQQVSAEVSA